MTNEPKQVSGTDIYLYDQAIWDRTTVADGKYLQQSTLEPISANDRILASAINKLNERIDLLEDASDVINVYGNWDDFVTHSGELFDTSAITNNDIIKVLNDKNEYPNSLFPYTEELTSGHQTYFRWSADNAHAEWPLDPMEGQWEFIGHLEPYYNTKEINNIIDDLCETVDNIIDDLSATVSDNYLSANKNAVIAGKNIQIDYNQNNPKITINTKEDVEFNNVSVENISATNVTALTAQGNSAKFTNLSATNLNDVVINDLFGSAYSGAEASAYITAHSADFLNSSHSAYSILAFGNKEYPAMNSNYKFTFNAGQGIGFTTGTNQVTIGVTDNLITSANAGSAASAYITTYSADFLNSAHNAYGKLIFGTKEYPATSNNYNFKFIAGQGINFTTGNNQVTISAEGTTYQAGDYISTANKTISVTGDLITSAEAGSAASAWVNNNINKIAYTSSFNGSNNVITGYGTSSFAGGISSISAKTGNSTALFTGYNVNIQAGPGIGFNFGTNLLTISANTNYTQGRCITIDDQNKINLSSDINLDSKLVIDHYTESDPETYTTASLESSKLNFSGTRDSGGNYRNQSATYRIDYLKIDNYYNADDLHFTYLDESKLQLSAFTKIGNYNVTTYTNLTNEYYETQWAGSPSNYYLKFDGHNISAGSDSSNVSTTSWLGIINNAKGTWVSATSQEIVVNAPYQTKFVVTSTIPTSLNANTYYII